MILDQTLLMYAYSYSHYKHFSFTTDNMCIEPSNVISIFQNFSILNVGNRIDFKARFNAGISDQNCSVLKPFDIK